MLELPNVDVDHCLLPCSGLWPSTSSHLPAALWTCRREQTDLECRRKTYNYEENMQRSVRTLCGSRLSRGGRRSGRGRRGHAIVACFSFNFKIINTYTQTDTQAERRTDGQTDRHTDRQTDRDTERQTDSHTGRHTDRQTDRQ